MNARKTCYIIVAAALVMSLPMLAAAQELERTTFLGNYFNVYGNQLLKFNTSDFIPPSGDDEGGWVGEPNISMLFQGTTIWGGTITTPCTLSNLIGNGCLRATWGEEVYSVVVQPCVDDAVDEVPSAPAVVTVYKPWDCGLAAGGKLILYSGCPLTPRCASFGMLFMLPRQPLGTVANGIPSTTKIFLPSGNPVRLLLEDPFYPTGPVTIYALNSFTATATLMNGKVICIDLCGRAFLKKADPGRPPKLEYLKASIFWDRACCCWKFKIQLTQYPNCVDYCAESCIFDGGVFARPCIPE